jgi:O-antigen ligase
MTKSLSSITRYSLFSLLVFTPLARGSVQGWAITVIHMVTLIALAAFFLEKSQTGNWKWIKTPLDKPIICILLLCLLSSVFSLNRYSSFWSMVLLINYVVIFYLIINTVRTRSQFRQLVYLIIGVAAFLSIFGLIKQSGANPFPWWDYPEITQNVNRLSATFGNANHLAGYMEMAIPLLLGLYLMDIKGIKLFMMICLSFLLLTTLILSLSRGGWFGALFGLFFMVFALLMNSHIEKKKKVILTSICGFLAVIFIVLASTPVVERMLTFEKMDKLEGREKIYGGIVEMIQDHPILGAGPGTFATIYTQYQPPGFERRYFYGHNDYLQLISEIGLPLIAILVWMIIALYKKGLNKLKNPSRLVRGITLGAMSGITAILFHSTVDFNLHMPANAILFTVLAALVATPIPE